MVYITSTEFIGADDVTRWNSRRYFIRTTPGETNVSQEPKLYGWLGTTNDWSRQAYGEFASVELARAWITDVVGALVPADDTEYFGPEVVACYRGTALIAWTVETSTAWCWASCQDLTAQTTDAEIAALVDEAVTAVAAEGGVLHAQAVTKMFTEYRDDLKQTQEEKRK